MKTKTSSLKSYNRTAGRYHPFKRRENGSLSPTGSEKENHPQKSMSAEPCDKKKKNSEGIGEGGGFPVHLQEMQRRLCPKEARISVEPLRCREIMVTTPSKGLREVYYYSFASESDQEDDEEDKGSVMICSRKSSVDNLIYEDWRVQTINAFPASALSKDRDDDPAQEDDDKDSSTEAVTRFVQIPFSHDYVFSVDKSRDDLHTILDILGGDKMSTRIIDAYLLLRLEKYYKDFDKIVDRQTSHIGTESYEFRNKKSAPPIKRPPTPINFQYLSVNFMPVKERDQPISTFKPNSQFHPDLTKFDENSDAQLIAPLYASKHLYLAVFDFREKVVTAYDSSWHYLPMELREGQINAILRAILNQACKNPRNRYSESLFSQWKIDWKEKSCPQYDEYSCGIYTIHYADNVLRGIADHKHWWKLSTKRVMQIRRHIVKELLSTTSVGRQFLSAISG